MRDYGLRPWDLPKLTRGEMRVLTADIDARIRARNDVP